MIAPVARFKSGLLLLMLALMLSSSIAKAEELPDRIEEGTANPVNPQYQLGHGLRLGNSGWTLGGYGDVAFTETDTPSDWALGLDALSGFLSWDSGGRWHFFTELELSDALVLSPGDSGTDDGHVVLERFYLDYVLRDEAKFRVGKFLTPVGRWNLIHAQPLVWTTSRPLITEATFPTNATGVMAYGSIPVGSEGIEYSLYASPGEELFPAPRKDTFNEAYGGRIKFSPLPRVELGFSYVDFELRHSANNRRKLYGADLFWSWRRFELSGEYAYRSTNLNQSGDERGNYFQLVAPLSEKLYGIGRIENFRDSGAARGLHLYVYALNYRYSPALSFKGEFSKATENQINVVDGFKASIAVLF